MADKFTLVGSWGTTPQTGPLLNSGAASLSATINESLQLSQKNSDDYDLVTDTPVPVSLGGVTLINVLVVFSNRPITIMLTSAVGTNQSVPCDGWLLLESRTTPITAVDLVRSPAQETKVSVFFGQKT